MEKTQIVEKLKNEHAEILTILKSASSSDGIPSSNWKTALLQAKNLFEHHLDFEDNTIYSTDFSQTSEFKDYPLTAQKFYEEMKDITVEVERFFKKYEVTTDFPDFNKDYTNLVNIIQKRMNAEETILFEQFIRKQTVETAYTLSANQGQPIHKVLFDNNINYIHLVFNQNEGLPEHNSNAPVYMTVLRGTLSAKLNDQPVHHYKAGTMITIPINTKMNINNSNRETLEMIVIKSPTPK